MTKEERFEEAARLFSLCDDAGDMTSIYTADEEEATVSHLYGILKDEPRLWLRKGWNIQQCYSNMYSKIILAYLLKEIQEGNILDKEFLEGIREEETDVFCEFCYDDMGYKTTKVLRMIVEAVLQKDGVFTFEEKDLDLFEVEEHRNEDEFVKARQAFRTSVIQEFPILGEYIEVIDEEDEDDYLFYDIATYPATYVDFEAELLIVHSKVMYEIMEHEQRTGQTELGKSILERTKSLMGNLLQFDFMYTDYTWTVKDMKSEQMHYCMVYSSQVTGDGYTFLLDNIDRLHKYQYVSIFTYLKLLEDIKEYRRKYLDL